MTAIKLGFYAGAMVPPGTHFEFDDTRQKAPRWAVPYGTPIAPPPAAGSTKPKVTMGTVLQSAKEWAEAGVFNSKPLDAQVAAHNRDGTHPESPMKRLS